MSNFHAHAFHPETGKLQQVEMLDGYFGVRRYGVRFPDGQVYSERGLIFVDEGSDSAYVDGSSESRE